MEDTSSTTVWISTVCILNSIDLDTRVIQTQPQTAEDLELGHLDVIGVSQAIDVKNYFDRLT